MKASGDIRVKMKSANPYCLFYRFIRLRVRIFVRMWEDFIREKDGASRNCFASLGNFFFSQNEMVLQGMYHKRESCDVTLTPPVESKAVFGAGGDCHRCHVSLSVPASSHQTSNSYFKLILKINNAQKVSVLLMSNGLG